MSVRKTILLSDENQEALRTIKKEYGFSSESQTINYLLHKEMENQEEKIAIAVRKELEENYLQKDRIKWATQTAEQNSIVILDVLNTILQKEKIDICISTDFAPSPVIQQSRERLREKIHYFKEKSDERKRKNHGTGPGGQ